MSVEPTLFTISRERKKACSSASESSSKRAPGAENLQIWEIQFSKEAEKCTKDIQTDNPNVHENPLDEEDKIRACNEIFPFQPLFCLFPI